MNDPVALWSFAILMIVHVIGDFGTPYRRFGISSWRELFFSWHYYQRTKQPDYKPFGDTDFSWVMNYLRSWGKFLLSEWVLVLNPLHFIWDKWSPLRRHPNYLKLDAHQIHPELGHYEENYEIYTKITDPIFWRWLAVDQLYHVLSNLLLAYLLGVIS